MLQAFWVGKSSVLCHLPKGGQAEGKPWTIIPTAFTADKAPNNNKPLSGLWAYSGVTASPLSSAAEPFAASLPGGKFKMENTAAAFSGEAALPEGSLIGSSQGWETTGASESRPAGRKATAMLSKWARAFSKTSKATEREAAQRQKAIDCEVTKALKKTELREAPQAFIPTDSPQNAGQQLERHDTYDSRPPLALSPDGAREQHLAA